jgi:hypothetical protein
MNFDHDIVVEIIVETLDDRPEDPKFIAEQYKNMALQYRSIGAVDAKILEVVRE